MGLWQPFCSLQIPNVAEQSTPGKAAHGSTACGDTIPRTPWHLRTTVTEPVLDLLSSTSPHPFFTLPCPSSSSFYKQHQQQWGREEKTRSTITQARGRLFVHPATLLTKSSWASAPQEAPGGVTEQGTPLSLLWSPQRRQEARTLTQTLCNKQNTNLNDVMGAESNNTPSLCAEPRYSLSKVEPILSPRGTRQEPPCTQGGRSFQAVRISYESHFCEIQWHKKTRARAGVGTWR